MKRQFVMLSKAEQERVETEYHRLKREDFDETMAEAKAHRVHEKALNPTENVDNELAQMAADPDIQEELRGVEELWKESPSTDLSS